MADKEKLNENVKKYHRYQQRRLTEKSRTETMKYERY